MAKITTFIGEIDRKVVGYIELVLNIFSYLFTSLMAFTPFVINFKNEGERIQIGLFIACDSEGCAHLLGLVDDAYVSVITLSINIVFLMVTLSSIFKLIVHIMFIQKNTRTRNVLCIMAHMMTGLNNIYQDASI
ncbi:hypothetical protein RF11_00572 [Thelohanellus kitauei]|uniref:Uncharacterized protein n=1 Tax=Thelohanellus kitauei TaxID=669202 RepID=A0A0C2JXJ0_THEKT|nr:hypothetical protein RF11_00572 [Thelohanellus kitauei]